MTIPLMLLSLLSVAFVFTLNINPLKSKGWFKSIIGHVDHGFLNMKMIEGGIHHAHDQAMYISLTVASIGIILSVLFYFLHKIDANTVSKKFNLIGLYSLSYNKFYVDKIYDVFLYKPFMAISWLCSKIDWDLYDQKFIDGWGWLTLKISDKSGKADYNILDQKIVDGFGHLTQFFGKKLKLTQNGIVQNYLLGAIIGFLILLLIF